MRATGLDSNHFASFNKSTILVPDQPTVGCQTRAAESNSLLHQIPMMVATTIN